jgi:hypothetical protein
MPEATMDRLAWAEPWQLQARVMRQFETSPRDRLPELRKRLDRVACLGRESVQLVGFE